MANLTEHVIINKWDDDINSSIVQVGGDTSNSAGLPDYADIIKSQLVSNEAVGKGIYQDFLYVDENNQTSIYPWEGESTTSTNAPQSSIIADSIKQLYNTMASMERFQVLLVDEIPKTEINLSAIYLLKDKCECGAEVENTYNGCYFIKTGKKIQRIDIPDFKVNLNELFFLTRAEYDAGLSDYVKEIEELLKQKFGKYWDDEGFALDETIDQIVIDITNDLKVAADKILKEVNTKVEGVLHDVDRALVEIDKKIESVETELNTKFDALETSINDSLENVNGALTEVNNKVDGAIDGLNSKFDTLEDSVNESLENVNDALTVVNEKVDGAIDGLNSKFDTLEDSVNDALTIVNEKVNSAIDGLNSKFDTLEDSVNDALTEVNNKVDGAIDGLNSKYDTREDSVNDALTEVNNKVDGAIDGLNSKFDTLEDSVNDALTVVNEKVDGAIENLNSKFDELDKNISDDIVEIQDEMSQLNENLNQHIEYASETYLDKTRDYITMDELNNLLK